MGAVPGPCLSVPWVVLDNSVCPFGLVVIVIGARGVDPFSCIDHLHEGANANLGVLEVRDVGLKELDIIVEVDAVLT